MSLDAPGPSDRVASERRWPRALDPLREVLRAIDALGQRAAQPRFARGLLSLLVATEACVLLARARAKPFWYDELLSVHISSLQTLPRIFDALRDGADGMTLGFHALMLAARALPLDPHLALRLPSLLAYLGTIVAAYVFVATRVSRQAGLVAALLISMSSSRPFAVEARCYSILIGFLALAAVAWQRVGQKPRASCWLALGLAGAVASHHLAVVAVGCFAVAEGFRRADSRRIRARVWLACAVGLAPFLLALPLLLRLRELYGLHFWSKASWGRIFSSYELITGMPWNLALAGTLLILLTAVVAATRSPSRAALERDGSGFPRSELVLIASLLGYPALLLCLSKLAGAGYVERYGAPAVLGLAFGSVFAIQQLARRRGLTLLLPALLVPFLLQAELDLRRNLWARPSELMRPRLATLEWAARKYPDKPVVIASGMRFLELQFYAPAILAQRLIEVADPAAAIEHSGSNSVDTANLALSRHVELPVRELDSFLAQNPSFVLQSSRGGFGWLPAHLLAKNYQLELLAEASEASFYLAKRFSWLE